MRKFYTLKPGSAGLLFYQPLLAILYRSLLVAACCADFLFSQGQGLTDSIPLGGNTWSSAEKGGRIDSNGITDWTDSTVWFDTWLRVTATGDLHIWIYDSAPGRSRCASRSARSATAMTARSAVVRGAWGGGGAEGVTVGRKVRGVAVGTTHTVVAG